MEYAWVALASDRGPVPARVLALDFVVANVAPGVAGVDAAEAEAGVVVVPHAAREPIQKAGHLQMQSSV